MNDKQKEFFKSFFKGAIVGIGGGLIGFGVASLFLGEIVVRKLSFGESMFAILLGAAIVLIAKFKIKTDVLKK